MLWPIVTMYLLFRELGRGRWRAALGTLELLLRGRVL